MPGTQDWDSQTRSHWPAPGPVPWDEGVGVGQRGAPPSPRPYRSDLPLQQLARARVSVVDEGAGHLSLLAVADGALQTLPGGGVRRG